MIYSRKSANLAKFCSHDFAAVSKHVAKKIHFRYLPHHSNAPLTDECVQLCKPVTFAQLLVSESWRGLRDEARLARLVARLAS